MFKYLFLLGQKWRNPSMKSWFQWLKSTEKWSVADLEQHQLKKLQEITLFAYQNSAFYKDYFDRHQFNPNQIKTLADVELIPKLSKLQLLANVDAIHTKKRFKKVYKATTSGSSGNSLQFFRDELADSFNRASILRGYSWYGVNPWEFSGYFWGFNFTFWSKINTRILDFLQHRFRIFSYSENDFKKFVTKLQKATYISGYSSMIYETAKLINTQNLPKPTNLKLAIGTSEKIFETYQTEINNAFGLKLTSEYGATETGIIGFECKEGSLHINMEGVLVEEIDHEILVTNLVMQSFPIIRYQLGDYIELEKADFKCNCGMNHRIIKEITGRIGETIQGKNQQYPSLYCYYIIKNLSKQHQINLNYVVIQPKKGALEFHIEQKLDTKTTQYLITEIQQYFKLDIDFEIIDQSLPKDASKKSTSFISYL